MMRNNCRNEFIICVFFDSMPSVAVSVFSGVCNLTLALVAALSVSLQSRYLLPGFKGQLLVSPWPVRSLLKLLPLVTPKGTSLRDVISSYC